MIRHDYQHAERQLMIRHDYQHAEKQLMIRHDHQQAERQLMIRRDHQQAERPGTAVASGKKERDFVISGQRAHPCYLCKRYFDTNNWSNSKKSTDFRTT